MKFHTKKVISLVYAILFVFSFLSAQDIDIPNDSTVDPILNELQIIRGFHEETHRSRQKAIEERYRNNADNEKKLSSDYELMSLIEDNTRKRPKEDGWNLYGWSAFLIALASLIVAGLSFYYARRTYTYTRLTYAEQSKTVDNTKKLSRDAQRHLLNDLLRHLYRNYVKTYTMRTKMKEIDYQGYPSEENYEKLKVPMENFHMEAFYGDDDKYSKVHNLYLNFRNYNEEIDVARQHSVDKNISKKTIDEDFDTLEFKVSYLTSRIIQTINEVWGDKTQFINEMKQAINNAVNETTNASETIDVEGSEKFERLEIKDLTQTSYSILYTPEELKILCDKFNTSVHNERKLNERRAWKVRMINF